MDAVELIGAALSAWAVWLTARRRPWCWPVGFASVLVYGWIFIDARLYSDALLQAAFAGLIVYGWLRWLKHLGRDGRVQVAALAPGRLAAHLALGLAGALALGYAMHRWTDAALPWLDAALTAFSLVAQWWQGRRHLAAWWLWIVVDVVYVGEYVYKDLLITALLYAGFVVLAAIGLRDWRRAREARPEAQPAIG
ncbi:MAG TPA: nicotinamide riboside transporter PnuC [Frateuria sp.]|uniref:nicotinamide riboside transporter PnuC n=1 Tax=Frateuria sp. TaxID=2211372 RepID=UPI002D7E23DC|nr:nicotinamide riboside transporter PnuC [Frateuria sp.]HET6804500.1 nicotinamide riboside transporter PnuC [Frateuria sp.]